MCHVNDLAGAKLIRTIYYCSNRGIDNNANASNSIIRGVEIYTVYAAILSIYSSSIASLTFSSLK